MRVRPLDGGAFSPIAAFVVLLVVLAGGTAFVLTRPEPAQPTATTTPQGSPSPPDHSLTNAEAIARFKELDRLRIRALEKRRAALLARVVTNDSPVGDRVRKTIAGLRRNRVVVDEQWHIRDVSVLMNTASSIDVLVVGTSDVRFFDENGNEVEQEAEKERRTVKCDLRLQGGAWLLHECDVQKVVNLERRKT